MTTTKEQRRLRQEERAVERIFYGHLQQPGSLAGSAKVLKRYVPPNVTQKVVRRFLAGQDAYTMHRPTRHRFERRRTYSKGIDDLFQADICDMTNVSSHNNSYRYMLTCIDVFSKFSWVVPLRTNNNNNNTLIYIAPACRMTSEALKSGREGPKRSRVGYCQIENVACYRPTKAPNS